ncbi:MAG: peptidoglycan-binding protein [Candidatus Omnitrophica bacterium]|nr:peptidoglycan-binding protein [Candidatus Omnitrophota bacterium]MBU1870047.1 peptidoglycan-binding protein [Candidatus Omnitrophota bacterium]
MRKISALLIFPVLLAGCVSTRSLNDIQSRVDSLESKSQQTESAIVSLRQGQEKLQANYAEQAQLVQKIQDEQKKAKDLLMKAAQARPKANMPDAKEIQSALKNAGFYKGEIDGAIGEKTKEAIRSFQSANDLNPDGVVGSRTWSALTKYLEERN